MEDKDNNILGCFFSIGYNPNLSEQEQLNLANDFKLYIFNEKGISNNLAKLKYEKYGKDIELILFKFYVKFSPIELQQIKEIESYRKKEKAIGIPIVVNDENFFEKSESDRYEFLKQSILQKMELLSEVVKKRKLDTNVDLLKSDLEKVLKEFSVK